MDRYVVIIILLAVIAASSAYCIYWHKKNGRVSSKEAKAPLAAVGLPNPLRKVESIEEVNSAVGCKMQRANAAEDESFNIINTVPPLGWYRFTVNGVRFNLRACAKDEDISGVYLRGGTLTDAFEGRSDADTAAVDGFRFLRRFDGDMQYVLWACGASIEEFSAGAEAFDSIWEDQK